MATKKSDSDPLSQIQKVYETLRDNYSTLMAAAQTDADREQLRDQYSNAGDAYWFAANHSLNDVNDRVINLTKELAVDNAALRKDLQDIQDLAQTLEDIKQAVTVAAAIAALAF